MNSKEIIKNKLREWTNEFPHMSFIYEFDQRDNTHLVEVSPLTDYESNKKYAQFEIDFSFYFERKFLGEEIIFISDDSLLEITNAEFKVSALSISESYDFGLLINNIISDVDCSNDNSTNFAIAA